MSSTAQGNTISYTTLPTHQRRIRHLHSIAARNIQNDGDLELADLKLYFSLHSCDKNQAFYTSDVFTASVNPTWKTFNLDHLALEDVNTSKTSLVVRVWRKNDTEEKVILEWNVALSGLVYFGDKLQREVAFAPNTLLFGMFGGFYIAPKERSEPDRQSLRDCELTVDQSLVRKSYSVMATDRIQTIQRAIKQTEMSGKNVRKSIEEALSHTKYTQQRKAAREAVAMRVAMLQTELEWRTNKLMFEKEKYERLQSLNIHRDRKLMGKFDTLKNDRSRLREKKKSYFDVREDLIKTGAQLVMRRKQLISELTLIYPILESPNEEYSILGIVLPNAEKLQGQSETQLEVAFGYTSHLVQMISQFLDMPLRYPMEHRGSKSSIHDHILDKLNDREREFPLYSKGKEKFQFDYGVYLLNKNIAQLRYYCGLGTTDLRLTLANLKTLLQLRLGVKFDHMEVIRQAQLQSSRSIMTSGNQNFTSPQSGTDNATNVKRDKQDGERNQSGARRKERAKPSHVEGSLDSELSAYGYTNSHIPKHLENKFDSDSDIFKGSPDSFFEVKVDDGLGQSRGRLSVSEQDSSVDHSQNTPRFNNEQATFQVSSNFNDSVNITQSQVEQDVKFDYDMNSHSSDSNHRPNSAQNRIAPVTALEQSLVTSDQSLATLEQLTKEKLLGPIANYEDIDVSSSEDSANAVYGQQFKFLRERTTFKSLMSDNLVNEENSPHLDDEILNSNEKDFKNGDLVENPEEINDVQLPSAHLNINTQDDDVKIENNSSYDSCKTPDSSMVRPSFNSSRNQAENDDSRKSSAPIDVQRPSLKEQTSEDSYMDSSPTFNLQNSKAC